MVIIMVIVLLAFMFFCLIMAVKSAEQIENRKNACRRAEKYVSYHNQTLFVTKRDPEIANIFTIQPYRKTQYGYSPEKLIYTGATVGGVTTGGWHKSGGFYARDRGNTGKVRLYYYYESDNKFVTSELERIELSPELARQAQSSNIAQYLSGNTIVIRHPVKNMDAAVGAMQLGYKDMAFNIIEDAKIAASPTIDKVRDIINWLAIYDPNARKSPEEVKAAKEKAKKAVKRTLLIAVIAAALIAAGTAIGSSVQAKQEADAQMAAYNEAVALLESERFDEAIAAFEALEDYENSAELLMEASYQKALFCMEQAQYSTAIQIFNRLDGYKESNLHSAAAKQKQEEASFQDKYDAALKKASKGDYEEACRQLKSLGDFSDSREQLDRITEQWYQEIIAQFDTMEDGVLWIDVSVLHPFVQATGGYGNAQAVLDYFGDDPTQGDTLYRRVKMACVEGNLKEAKALLEESGLLDWKPVHTLYDAVSAFVPYCGDFGYASGDQSILENTESAPVRTVHTWVKFKISGEENTIVAYELWIKNNDNAYGDYRFGDFKEDAGYFFRSFSKTNDYTAEVDGDGNLVFKKYGNGKLDQVISIVTYAPAVS